MRILIGISCLLVFFSMNVSADDSINEQQIMLYYQIPLDGGNARDSMHQFGLRLDQVTHVPGEDVHISALENKTASMDFRMNYSGIHSLKIRGVDYRPYLVARAAEGEAAPAAEIEPAAATTETAPTTAETQPAEAAPAEGTTTATAEAPKDEKGIVQKTLDALPFGVIIGVAFGAVLLVGVDN